MTVQNPAQASGIEESAITSSYDGHAATETKVCRTILIADVPSDTDKFGTHSHSKVADAIAELITSGVDGVSVGVEGSWGSGKTTVFNLLKSRFANQKNYALILFDAWAHEGDPLRLTFLQSVLQHLQEHGWITEERRGYWKEKLEEIANQRQTEITKDYPSLSSMGKAFTISLLLVPLSAAFANAALRDDKLTLFDFTSGISWRAVKWFGAALLFALSPLLILLVQRLRMSKEEHEKSSGPWSLLFTKGVVENRKETQKTANPTSIDFEKTFDELMDEALGASDKSSRRLILVIDNLDRVDSEVALTIWATLQTFLKHRSSQGAEWAKRLWVLALYDRRGLSLIWEKAVPNEAAAQQPAVGTEPTATVSTQAAGEQGGTALSFMDKSFQVRFEVPAPVLSNWRDFLVGLLREAFPDHRAQHPQGNGEGPLHELVEDDFHAVYRVLAIYLNGWKLPPTIRELKLYVNQIGSIHRQWAANTSADPPREADAFPLSHMAYYALLRRRGRDVVRGLLATDGDKLPEPEYVDLLGEGIADNLAALAFNVEVKLARQLLISPELKNALGQAEPKQGETGQGDSAETLKGLADSYPEGFWEVLEETVREVPEEWKGDEASKVAYAAYNLERSGLLERSRPEVKNITGSLCTQASKVSSWTSLDEQKARGLAVILRWKRQREPNQTRARKYATDTLRAVAAGFDSARDEQKWSALTKILQDELASLSIVDTFDEGLVEPLASQLIPRTNSRWPDEKIRALLELLTELRTRSPLAGQRLGELAKDGRLLFHWYKGTDAPSHTLQGWLLFVFLREVPNAEVSADAGPYVKENHDLMMNALREPVADTVDKFTEIIRRYGEVNLLFVIQSNLPDARQFVGFCLKHIFEGEDALTLLPSLNCYSEWPSVSAALKGVADAESALDNYLRRAITEQHLAQVLSSYAFNYQASGLYLRILRILAGEGADDPAFRSWFAAGLKTVDKSQWVKELRGEGDLLKAAAKANEREAVNLGEPYRQALLDHAEMLQQDEIRALPLLQVGEPAKLLDPSLAGQFRTGLYEQASRAKGSIDPYFFQYYGMELLSSGEVREGDKSYEDLFIPLLVKRNVRGLKWMDQVFSYYGRLISDTKQSKAIDAFKAALSEELNAPQDEATPSIVNLSRMFESPSPKTTT
jgi:hypothetical protein